MCQFVLFALIIYFFNDATNKIVVTYSFILQPMVTMTNTASKQSSSVRITSLHTNRRKNPREGKVSRSIPGPQSQSVDRKNNNNQWLRLSMMDPNNIVDGMSYLSSFSDDINYFTQSIANQLASISMQDIGSKGPTDYLTSLPLMYGAGLLTSASPCVWGLLPLTMSYISSAAGEREDHQTTLPTLAFAAGLATVFCTLGFVAVELGGVFGGSSNSSDSSSSSILLSILSNGVCLIMGLKLLDLIQIRFPSIIGRDLLSSITKSWSRLMKSNRDDDMGSDDRALVANGARISRTDRDKESLILIDATGRIMSYDEMKSRKESSLDSNDSNIATTITKNTNTNIKNRERGSLIRTFLLGGSSALVASPCATPVLTSILAYVSSASNPLVGALLLFMYTAGYSTPLLIVAATGGQALENLRQKTSNISDDSNNNNPYARIGPWITPITGGILLWYGTDGLLHSLIGDPSLAGLKIYS
jgi:cytochrome c biogenesis protein CcdA